MRTVQLHYTEFFSLEIGNVTVTALSLSSLILIIIMDAKKQASLQAARAASGRKRKHANERNEILCNNLSLPKRRRGDKSFDDDFRRIVDFHLLIRELKNGCHYCWQRPLLPSEGILQDPRSQSPDKIQIMCRSCKRLSHVSINNSTEGKLKGSFDVSWRKQQGYNSLIGHGAIFGYHTKNCIIYGTKNAYCKTCQQSMRMGKPANEHDCRQNHSGSAKAMEACLSEELFRKGDYGVMITDEDASSESKVKQNVNHDIEKWSDKNHVVVTFRKMLISGKARDFGKDSSKLSDSVIDYFAKLFSMAVSENKLKASFQAIVPHAFGDHKVCKDLEIEWCQLLKDPENFQHKYLEKGEDLLGDGLRSYIEGKISSFTTDEFVRKLAPGGSTQVNENLNMIVGTKNPKIRFYGGSESSDFHTAASVGQANERYSYLTLVYDRLKHTTCIPQLDKFVTIKDRQFSKAKLRRAAIKYKRRRKSLKEIRKRTTKIKESIEGTTYESGVGADQTAKKIMEIIYHPSPHVNKAIEWMKEKCPRYRNDKVS